MSDVPQSPPSPRPTLVRSVVEAVGRGAAAVLDALNAQVAFIGALADLLAATLRCCVRGLFIPGVKVNWRATVSQTVRVGVRSVSIVVLVQVFIGVILALQLAPTLESYGQLESIATVVGIAVVRELGPLITAIVLSGYAGASIAAELGAMVESEEIKALRAHALSPYSFLVVPRFLATVIAMVGLTVIADIVGVLGGFGTAWLVLDVPPRIYLDITQNALKFADYLTGLFKAGVFGVLISMIACREGLSVSGGAVGVGKATTDTVVKCIVALIGTDAIFTAIFYSWGI